MRQYGNIIRFDGLTEYEAINIETVPTTKVGLECRTYNQKEYIRDALEGILMQHTSFSFSVLIIDDASSDGTQDIIREYTQKYPNKVMALLARKNIFGKKQSREVYGMIFKKFFGESRYVATCEGDDFWTDKNKLQIQADYMDNHPDCMMYLHNSWWFDCIKKEKKRANPFDCVNERNLSPEEIIMIEKGHPATASRMYRSELLSSPTFVTSCSVGDYPLMLYAATKGTVHYSDRIMCTYRYMRTGSTCDIASKDNGRNYLLYHHIGLVVFLLEYDIYTKYRYHDIASRKAINFLLRIMNIEKSLCSYDSDLEEFITPYQLSELCSYKNYIKEKILQISNTSFMGEHLKDFIERHKHIIIFGTGTYSEVLTEQLKNSGVDFVGYVKSSINEQESCFKGKPLWSINSLPNELAEAGVLIGVLPKQNDGIDRALIDAGINNYFYPYGFNKEEMMKIKKDGQSMTTDLDCVSLI